MKKAITHLKLGNANRRKLNELDKVAEAYLSLVQAYVDHIFDHDLRDVNKYDSVKSRKVIPGKVSQSRTGQIIA